MKRTILGGLLLATCAMIAPAGAQDHTRPQLSLGGTVSRTREEKPTISADYLIFQRARWQADQRAARLEMYRWMGHSPQRPVVRPDPFTTDLNPGLYGWGYRPPVWRVRW